MQSSDVAVTTPCIERPLVQCGAGKLIDNPEALPEFTIENVVDYLINRKENDCMRAEDWKNFKTGGYKLFKEGHVQKIMINQEGAVCTVSCSCLPEMKKDRIYKIKVDIAVDTSDVCGAECSCPAGRGPHASCKHVAASLFALEDFYSTYKEFQASSDDDVACTSKLQTWNQPRKRHLDSKCSNEITFRVEDYHHKPCRKSKPFLDPRPAESQLTTEAEITDFLHDLESLNISCGFLNLMVVTESSDDPSSKFPLTPRSAQMKINADITKECPLPPTYETVSSYFDKFVMMITPTNDQQRTVEENTRRQGGCKRWKEERYLRLTASNFGRVMLRQSNHTKLAEEILHSKLPDTIPSLKWGRTHENEAFTEYLESYLTDEHELEAIRKAGFYIGNPSFLGASPDGIIDNDGCHNCKIIEIKCPYGFRDFSVEEACTKKGFYCTIHNGDLHLKRNHIYHYQVQRTMAITNATECDFIVWTPKSMKVEKILFDEALWLNEMLPKLRDFYYKYMLPLIVY